MHKEKKETTAMMSHARLQSFSNQSGSAETGLKPGRFNKLRRVLRKPPAVLWWKNKGAVLVLIWCHLVLCGYYLIRHRLIWQTTLSSIASPIIAIAVIVFLSPAAGWLADVYFGRYKVLKWSIRIMWISCMLLTTSSILGEMTDNQKYSVILEMIMLVGMETGFSGCISNILQFGMDQIPDVSTEVIVSFLRWIVWTFFSSAATLDYTLFCTDKKYELIGLLVVCISLTIAVCLDCLFNHHFNKEPTTANPFKLVIQVIRYAIKTKQPRYRSAFTYCEDEPPSRIDFGKSKYGGPFTSEQVEDVKTFLRVLLVTFVAGCLPGPFLFLEYAESKLTNQFLNAHDVIEGCYTAKDIAFLYSACGFLAIPLYDFFIYPIFWKHIPSLRSNVKLFIGFLFVLLKIFGFISIDLISTHTNNTARNKTVECMFRSTTGVFKDVLDHRWFSIPIVLDSFSSIFVIMGIIEFTCAQIPYSMKGVFMGVLISILCIFFAVGVSIFIPFTLELPIWEISSFSCSFWCFLTNALIIVFGLVLTAAMIKWYKKRKREDVLPNEHIFAERYYSS